VRATRPTIATYDSDDNNQSDFEETRQAVPLSAVSAKPVVELHQAEEPRARAPRAEAPRAERPRWSPGAGPSLSDKGLKGFRDVIAETETLGSATAEAAENVRAYQAATNADLQRAEPRSDNRTETRGEPTNESEPARPSLRRSSRDTVGREALPGRVIGSRDAGRGRSAGLERRQEPPFAAETDEPQVQDPWTDFEAEVRSEHSGRAPSSIMRQEDARGGRGSSSSRPARAERQPLSEWATPRTSNRIIAMAVMALLVLALVAATYWWGPDIVARIRGTPGSNLTAGQVTPGDSTTRGKFVERAPSAIGSSEGALVAQKVVLYEEDQTNPNGTQFVGSSVWRTERVSPGPGQKPDLVVRAEIDIPEQKISIRWSLRRNDDKQGPTSHTIEIMFTLPPDFSHGGISSIPGVLMKQGETTRGIPLNGIGVKVTANVFLIGLSSVDADMQRNLQLLKERSWFDIPVVYGDGKRAIIAIEKGTPGERAFTEAFAAWGQ